MIVIVVINLLDRLYCTNNETLLPRCDARYYLHRMPAIFGCVLLAIADSILRLTALGISLSFW